MGYTKYVRYGDTLEVYEYEKNVSTNRTVRYVSPLERKRRRDRIQALGYVRSDFSIKRAKRSFFRLCHHNNTLAASIHFITLTFADDIEYSDSLRAISAFFRKIKILHEIQGHPPITYIAVPELTKKNRYHFHLLVYNLPPEASGTPISIRYFNRRKRCFCVQYSTTERFTRYLQNKWLRGFVDISPATYTSKGIAGYMAKYMGKALGDPKFKARRAYNCSRNINKIYDAGGNTHDSWKSMIIPDDAVGVDVAEYKVPYLGTCNFIRYKV